MNDGWIIGGLAIITIGFVLLVAITHFAWMMRDRKMRSVAGGADPNDLSFVPLTGRDVAGVVVSMLLLFGVLAGGVAHTKYASIQLQEAGSQ
jgi:hypothetical protein